MVGGDGRGSVDSGRRREGGGWPRLIQRVFLEHPRCCCYVRPMLPNTKYQILGVAQIPNAMGGSD